MVLQSLLISSRRINRVSKALSTRPPFSRPISRRNLRMRLGLRPTLCLRYGSVLTTSTIVTPARTRMSYRRRFSMYTGNNSISCITMVLETFYSSLYPVGEINVLRPEESDNEPCLAFNKSPLVLSYNSTAQAQEAAGITAWNDRLRATASEFQAERHGTTVTVIDTSVHTKICVTPHSLT